MEGPLTNDSSISSDESTSYFEKPLRTLSEDTVITPPSASPTASLKEKSLPKVQEYMEEEDEEVCIIHPATPSPIQTPPLERKLSHKLSAVSFSDMNDVSLEDQAMLEEESYNPLKIITNGLMNGTRPNITTVPVPTRIRAPTPPPKDEEPAIVINRDSIDNESITSTSTTTKSIFALWSPFRSSSSANTSPASSRRPSKQNSAPVLPSAPRPSASFVTRQRRLSRPTSIISPLPGFQEALLAQMEQVNSANTNDPKSKVIKNLKRQSIRHSLVSQNKGDGYDWGKKKNYIYIAMMKLLIYTTL